MRKSFYKKSFKQNRSGSLPIFQKQFFKGLVFLICFSLVIVFIFGDHGLLKLYKIKNERQLIQKKIAREKYKMVKPGEKIFKVVNN